MTLVRTSPAAEHAVADDVTDLLDELRRGASPDYVSAADVEDERRASESFFTALARAIDSRLPWAAGRAVVAELASRDGWSVALRDRDGRPYDVTVTYSALADVALLQRAHDTERGPSVMAGLIVERLEAARRRWFERMRGPEVGP